MINKKIILLRLPAAEVEAIKAAAAAEHRSVNMWCRLALVPLAKEVNRLPHEARRKENEK